MLGSALFAQLAPNAYYRVRGFGREEGDLNDKQAVLAFFEAFKPEIVIHAAAKVGGILANQNNGVDFILDNLRMQQNVIDAAIDSKVKQLIFLGSGCIYPKNAALPIKEEALLNGYLEESNQYYALAKIAGLKSCEALFKKGLDFISLLPSNLYGPHDYFNASQAHVIPAMFQKFSLAKIQGKKNVDLWGSGKAEREFLFVEDLADAIILCLGKKLKHPYYNVGSGESMSIQALATKIKKIVGFRGEIHWNTNAPEGFTKRILDSSKIKAEGWQPQTSLDEGLTQTFEWYQKNKSRLRL